MILGVLLNSSVLGVFNSDALESLRFLTDVGLGIIALVIGSELNLKALRRLGKGIVTEEPAVCISGEILQGLKKPDECPAFGTECTPTTPLGATMVSSEGACAAYHKYARKGL